MNLAKNIFTTILTCLLIYTVNGQTTTVSGRVIDDKGEGIPLASVRFNKEIAGVTSDLDGYYKISTSTASDSIVVKSFGYGDQGIAVQKGGNQTINVVLTTESQVLSGVTISAGENPAFAIMRKVVNNKKLNDRAKLDAYEYESYSKIEFDVDNMSEKFKEKKILSKLNDNLSSVQMLKDEKGREVFPVFFSETISRYFVRNKPKVTKEIVDASKFEGISVSDGSLTAQFVGTSFQNFSLYDNTITVLEKEFLSPISSTWRVNYKFELLDTLVDVNGYNSYVINVKPKRPQDLAFEGTIWIHDTTYALTKVDLRIPKSANLNYIDGIEVQRDYVFVDNKAWLPKSTYLEFDLMEPTKNWAGMIVKTRSSFSKFVINKPKTSEFYEYPIEVDPTALTKDEEYWNKNRHDTLSAYESNAFALVDTLKNLPIVRTYIDLVSIFVNGHKRIGKFDIGAYVDSYAYNEIEEHRLRLGFKTNFQFSNKWVFNGYLAYGLGDERWKYSLQGLYIISRKPWTTVGAQTRRDIDLLGLSELFDESSLFTTFSRWGNMNGAFIQERESINFYKQLNRHFSQKVEFKYRKLSPLFDFKYYPNPSDKTVERSTFTSSEVSLHSRFSKNEVFFYNDNDRVSLGSNELPNIDIDYTLGISDFLGSDFNYHKLSIMISQKLGMGTLGKTKYWLKFGKVFDQVPYPLLETHVGNETPFYSRYSFNLMNNFEFVSDQYTSLSVAHHFEGFFMNRIPIMKRLKWRVLANLNVLYGSVRDENLNIIPSEQVPFNTLEKKPYVEIGYGISNILKVFRVEVFHRLSYLNLPNASPVGVKFGAMFTL